MLRCNDFSVAVLRRQEELLASPARQHGANRRSGNPSQSAGSAAPPPTAGPSPMIDTGNTERCSRAAVPSPAISIPSASICTPVFHLASLVTGRPTRTPARYSRKPLTRISRSMMTIAGYSPSALSWPAPDQHHQRRAHQQLVGDRVEHPPEIGKLAPGARQVAVEIIGHRRGGEQQAGRKVGTRVAARHQRHQDWDGRNPGEREHVGQVCQHARGHLLNSAEEGQGLNMAQATAPSLRDAALTNENAGRPAWRSPG